MPYIERKMRGLLEPRPPWIPMTPGELNFVITRTVDEYLASHGADYQKINEVIGALECAKLELYRRIATPYEDDKMAENGDVYTVNTER